MSTTRKWLVAIGLAVALPAAAAFLYADELTRRAIERGGRDALGVDLSLSFVRLGLLGGGIQIEGLSVANPPGFEQADLLRVGHVQMGVALPALLADRVLVPSLDLTDVRVDLERRGMSTNYDRVLDHLRRADEPGGSSSTEDDDLVIIREVRIRNVEADVRVLPELDAIPGAQTATGLEDVRLHIPEIVLRNVRSKGNATDLVTRLTGLIAAAVLDSVARHATGLPSAMVDELASVGGMLGNTSLELVGEVTQAGADAVGGTLGAEIARDGADTERVVSNVARGATHAVQDLARGELP